MKYTTLLAASALATPIEQTQFRPVALSFDKTYGETFAGSQHWRKLSKRDISLDLTNQQNFFSVQLDIGTPAQAVTVLIDTGSSDLWVTGVENPFCIGSPTRNSRVQPTIDCKQFGTFDSSKSSSFKSNDTDFLIQYGDGSFALGTWATDTLSIGGINADGLSFAVANATNSTVGVLGIGLAGLESTNVGPLVTSPKKYANLPQVLVNDGVIAKNAYSLFLNSLEATSGELLFGAVDSGKYTGGLFTIPMINTLKSQGLNSVIQFDVTVQGLGFDSPKTQTTFSTTRFAALLDSGTTLTYLPPQLLQMVTKFLGAQFSNRLQAFVMNCPSDGGVHESLVFDFGGFQISAPLANFLIPAGSQNVCVLGLMPADDNGAIFGDNFLSAAYVVYDLEKLEVSMGQADYQGTSNVQPLVAGGSVPGAQKAAGYSSTWTADAPFVTGGNIFTVTGGNQSGTAVMPNTATGTRSRGMLPTGTATSAVPRKNEGSLEGPGFWGVFVGVVWALLF